MNDVRFSIIVPVYNVEKYLDKCISSILNQTYKNLEIILVDDGSTDLCPQLCDKYAEIDRRIQVIHKKNGGLSSARNAGIDIATGDFIMFVDSDDYISELTCEKIVKNIASDVDIISFQFQRVYDDETKNEIVEEQNTVKIVEGNELFRNYINRTDFTHMVCDKAYRNSLFKDVRFIEGRLAEDMACSYLLFGRARRAIAIKQVFYYYYTRDDSIMGQGGQKLILDAYKGETEAYNYGNKYFPEFKIENNTRYMNQSMKTYLKLKYKCKDMSSRKNLNMISKNISKISKKGLPKETLLFYVCFSISKPMAWKVFETLKLS